MLLGNNQENGALPHQLKGRGAAIVLNDFGRRSSSSGSDVCIRHQNRQVVRERSR